MTENEKKSTPNPLGAGWGVSYGPAAEAERLAELRRADPDLAADLERRAAEHQRIGALYTDRVKAEKAAKAARAERRRRR